MFLSFSLSLCLSVRTVDHITLSRSIKAFPIRRFLEREYSFETIGCDHLVLAFMTACSAMMEDFPALTERFNSDRFHQPTTARRPISRMDIDMLTVETTRAMIGESIADDLERTVSTAEILRTSLKSPSLESFVHVYQYTIRSPTKVNICAPASLFFISKSR